MTAFVPQAPRNISYVKPRKSGLFIDASTSSLGYVTAGCVGGGTFERLKFQVRKYERTYNYDLPLDRKPIQFPINMGNGSYLFRIMERVEGNRYAEVCAVDKSVKLLSRFVPFTVPTVYCEYSTDGPCASTALSLCGGDELDVLNAIHWWVARGFSYDYKLASELSKLSGYVPKPDVSIVSKSGICLDYASVTGAMLRSIGIPCKVITGYVNGVYHAWVSAYVNGKWRRRDPTFASVIERSGMRVSTSSYKYENRFIY